MIHTKKCRYSIPFFILLFLIAVSNKYLNEIKLREYNFKKYELHRQEVVEQILEGSLKPDDTGTVHLPITLKNEEMAKSGCVYIVEYRDKKGIYFCTFSGIMDSSAGFVFLTKDFDNNANLNNTIILHEQYNENWYYCGTDS